MKDDLKRERRARRRAKRKPPFECHCCRETFPFAWRCRTCGFTICQSCLEENFWGMSCNGIIWQCPDCGEWNGLGNQ